MENIQDISTQQPIETPETKKISPRKLSKEIQEEISPSRRRYMDAQEQLRREWEVENVKVTGIFRDLEVGRGGNLRFSARKYKWDPVESYHFVDGETYTVPLWVAKHLNEDCKYPVYRHDIDPAAKEGEKARQIIGKWNHRFAFVSSEFVGLAKAPSPSVIGVQR
jgi:hypothetical protein